MKKMVWFFLAGMILHGSLYAADKIRVSVSSLDVAFLTGGVAFKRGFFKPR